MVECGTGTKRPEFMRVGVENPKEVIVISRNYMARMIWDGAYSHPDE